MVHGDVLSIVVVGDVDFLLLFVEMIMMMIVVVNGEITRFQRHHHYCAVTFRCLFFVGEPPGELRMFVLGYTPWHSFFAAVAVIIIFIIFVD